MVRTAVFGLHFGRVLVVVCGAVAAMSLHAQASAVGQKLVETEPQAQLPAFDVVSIKPHKDEGMRMRMGISMTPDGFVADGVPVFMLMHEAFRLSEDRILNEPEWVKSARFDINAKVAPEDAPRLKPLSMQQRAAMMLPVLEDRFGLKYHHETRELQVYTLVVAKGGPKMKEAASAAGDPPGSAKPGGGGELPPPLPPAGGGGPEGGGAVVRPGPGGGPGGKPQMMMRMSPQGMTMEGRGTTMGGLVQMLSQQISATVVDKTGLVGSYDFTLTFMPDIAMGMGPMMKGPGGPGPQADGGAQTQEPVGPSIFTAVQEQLGLKLVAQKTAVDVVVVDHIEQPTEN